MRLENRRWLVIPTSIIDTINFDEVHGSGVDSLRKSIDNSSTFVKYEVKVYESDFTETFTDIETGEEKTNTISAGTYGRPSIYSDSYTEYTHAQILTLLATEAWSINIQPE